MRDQTKFNPQGLHVPNWVQWLAQDADGTWWAYECEPNEADCGWYENEIGKNIRLTQQAPNADWRSSLLRWRGEN